MVILIYKQLFKFSNPSPYTAGLSDLFTPPSRDVTFKRFLGHTRLPLPLSLNQWQFRYEIKTHPKHFVTIW